MAERGAVPAVTVSLSNAVVVVVSAVSMCSQKLNVAVRAAGRDGDRLGQGVGVGGAVAVEPGVPGAGVGGLAGAVRVDDAGGGRSTARPSRSRSRGCRAAAPRCSRRRRWLTVQVKDAEPVAPVVSVAVTVTLEVPAVVGGAGDQAGGGADRQAGGQAGGASRSASGRRPSRCAWICRLTAVPTVPWSGCPGWSP